MTLRVTVEVVPFGDEERKYTLGFLECYNQGRGYKDTDSVYKAAIFSDNHTLLWETVDKCILHERNKGYWPLINKALKVFLSKKNRKVAL